MGEPKMEESINVPTNPKHSSLQNQIIASVICKYLPTETYINNINQ